MTTLKCVDIKNKYKIELIEDDYGRYFIVYSQSGYSPQTSKEISSLNLAFDLFDKLIEKNHRYLN